LQVTCYELQEQDLNSPQRRRERKENHIRYK